jgi:hypothetical protein
MLYNPSVTHTDSTLSICVDHVAFTRPRQRRGQFLSFLLSFSPSSFFQRCAETNKYVFEDGFTRETGFVGQQLRQPSALLKTGHTCRFSHRAITVRYYDHHGLQLLGNKTNGLSANSVLTKKYCPKLQRTLSACETLEVRRNGEATCYNYRNDGCCACVERKKDAKLSGPAL